MTKINFQSTDVQIPNQILSHDQILAEMNSIGSEFEPLVKITPDQRQLLLLKVNWDIKSLRKTSNEYTDMNKLLLRHGICPKNMETFIKKSECAICCAEGKVFGLRCQHMACADCWKNYLTNKIKSGHSLLHCMSCHLSISNETLEKFLNDPKLMSSHQKLVIDSYVKADSSLKWCNEKCGKAVRRSTSDTVLCACGSKFCFSCGSDPHLPATCRQKQLWNKKRMDNESRQKLSDDKSSSWILGNTKDCPYCGAPIEKRGGCNRMVCTRCNYRFCWKCCQNWSIHGGICKLLIQYPSKMTKINFQSTDVQIPNQILSHDQILTEMSSVGSEHDPLVKLTPDQRQLLLLKFNWDIKLLRGISNGFTDMNKLLLRHGICPKNMVTSTKKSECAICCAEGKVFGLRCQHMACGKCWKDYLSTKIKSGHSLLRCISCPMSISNEALEKFLNDPKLLSSYQKLVIDSYVRADPSLKWCNEKCGKAVRRSTSDTVLCACGSEFCFSCGSDPHLPATCRQKQLWNKKRMDNESRQKLSNDKSSSWILGNTKECPHCWAPIEKRGGCNHMVCTRCNYQFCWKCCENWKYHEGKCKLSDIAIEQSREKSRFPLTTYPHNTSTMSASTELMNLEPTVDTTPCQILTPTDILTEMNVATSQIQTLLHTTPEQSQLILQKFNWDIESLRERFLEIPVTNTFLREYGIPSTEVVTYYSECDICCAYGRVLGLGCGHVACLKCWSRYLTTQIKDGQGLLRCMNFGCNMLISNEKLGKFCCDRTLIFTHQKLIIDSYVRNNSSLTWCNKKCMKAIRHRSGGMSIELPN
ncbi:hypothetical protein CAEBREN_01143 [Caenorhabditis brenneri]|uniref:RBR-type E3 ubiquitin transferase n=1 Tax=Caenorhabditis brenneri TaxID=135651 RepID=G0MMI8_CAEBE|nr:hypothetical protein CAEBREN_01143 [Caenorhabditis brenneri]